MGLKHYDAIVAWFAGSPRQVVDLILGAGLPQEILDMLDAAYVASNGGDAAVMAAVAKDAAEKLRLLGLQDEAATVELRCAELEAKSAASVMPQAQETTEQG